MKLRGDLMEVINRKKPEGLNKLDQAYRVLVVDDSATMRKIVGQQLKSEAYEIVGEAANGADALELYKEKVPDVVTLDINMPVMSGIEALQKILEWDKEANVIMLTSEGQKETVIEAVSMGAKGYIVKPPNKMKVCAAVQKALNE